MQPGTARISHGAGCNTRIDKSFHSGFSGNTVSRDICHAGRLSSRGQQNKVISRAERFSRNRTERECLGNFYFFPSIGIDVQVVTHRQVPDNIVLNTDPEIDCTASQSPLYSMDPDNARLCVINTFKRGYLPAVHFQCTPVIQRRFRADVKCSHLECFAKPITGWLTGGSVMETFTSVELGTIPLLQLAGSFQLIPFAPVHAVNLPASSAPYP